MSDTQIVEKLANIINILSEIEASKSEIKEANLKVFEELFSAIYDVGISDEGKFILEPPEDCESLIESLLEAIKNLLIKEIPWIKQSVRYFARTKIDFFAGESPGDKIYQIRSGIEFFCVFFSSLDESFEPFILEFQQFVSEEFDGILTAWTDSGIGYFKEKPDEIPGSHWWWNQ